MKRIVMVFLVVLVFLGGLSLIATAQEEASQPAPPPADAAATTAPVVEKKADQPESYDINYAYDPGGRRDPFVSLITGIKQDNKVPKGALTVTDAVIVGITRNKEGFVAIIVGADRKSRFMKVGDKLYDGEIIAIEADRVVFRQDLTEDAGVAPGLKSKEVVKRLHPVQEGT